MTNIKDGTDFLPKANFPLDENGISVIQVVQFFLIKEHFAIDLSDVREVVEYASITPLPNSSKSIKGIIYLRGEVTSMIDINNVMRLKEDFFNSPTYSRIIVLDKMNCKNKIGLLVDDVMFVTSFERNQVDFSSSSLLTDNISINGIIKRSVEDDGKWKNELTIWLNINSFLQNIILT